MALSSDSAYWKRNFLPSNALLWTVRDFTKVIIMGVRGPIPTFKSLEMRCFQSDKFRCFQILFKHLIYVEFEVNAIKYQKTTYQNTVHRFIH